MSVSYVTPGNSPTASELNALTAELDTALRVLFADKSWYVYLGMAGNVPEGTKFYIGDDSQWVIIPALFGGSVVPYDHSTFTSAAAAFTVDTFEATNETAAVTQADPWPLAGSLEAHTIDDSGTTYFYRQDRDGAGDYGSVERYKKLAVAEILIEALGSSTMTWSSDYDRYHFLRFHNLDNQELTITLPGGSTVVVPKFGVRAVRRTYPAANSWDSTYVYLWKAVSGDSLCWDSEPANNVGSMMAFHRWIDSVSPANDAGAANGRGTAWTAHGLHLDPTVVYDGSSYLETAIAGTTELAKYEHHLGELCVWQNASDPAPTHATVSPTWTSLLAGTGGIKLTAATGSVPHVLTISADTGAVTPVDVFGKGSTITPRLPKTASFTIACSAVGIGVDGGIGETLIPGVETYLIEDTESYFTDFGATQVDVDYDYDYYLCGGPVGLTTARFTSPITASHWSTLTDHATLATTSTDEKLTTPTVTWKSDGWRLVACATQEVPPDWFTYPGTNLPETQLCAIDQTDGFSFPCGNDVLGRDSWDITIRQQGRVMSDYVGSTAGSTVTHTGHPDVTGHEPLTGGIEWRESRQANYDVATNRTESIGLTQASTKTLPVFVGDDSAEFLARSHEDAAWYAAHRTDLLAGSIPFEAEQECVRLLILALHYNHIAQRLNSIFSIDPFTYDDVVYYGELGDGTWPHATWPPDFQAAVLSTGSRADSLGITVNTMTVNSTSGYYVTQTDCKTWAAAAGFRYWIERFVAMYDYTAAFLHFTDSDDTFPYRSQGSLAGIVWSVRPVDDDTTRGPLARGPAMAFTPGESQGAMLELERVVDNGPNPPTGWTLDDASWVMAAGYATVHYDNASLVKADLDDNWEPFSFSTPPTAPPKLWPLTDLPQFTAPQDVGDLYSITADVRDAFQLMIIPRFLFLRS